ncbi:hypothetical protein TcasGA2_TC010984 [Tribolium castaneum]|uniref:Uncharacterized protein n=1 Tax=Tribolium castaneum TaxID=7070 RepID=D6X1F1_TRICA|nr:hypothetical protein TcasGA2_TC010984 [Tribolium castaneum]
MADQLLNLNKIAACEYTDTYVSANDLEVNKKYKIINLTKANTQHGVMMVAYLDNVGKVFLPKRLTAVMNDTIITTLMEGLGSYLIYMGRKQANGNQEHDAHIFNFERIIHED